MSTQGHPATPWREEVNRRLAEHKNRKGNPSPASAPEQPASPGASRAAQAAARVAARYAKAKSYSQMQAEEARIAVRNAEIATQVAIQAQSAAESALAELHAASVEQTPAEPLFPEPAQLIPFESAARHIEPAAEPEFIAEPAPEAVLEVAPEPAYATVSVAPVSVVEPAPAPVQTSAPKWDWAADTVTPQQVPAHVVEAAPQHPAVVAAEPAHELPAGPVTDAKTTSGQLLQIRWEPDMPIRSAKSAPESAPFELTSEDWWTAAEQTVNHDEPVEIEAHAIPANLIHFPREIVATRRIRPHNIEGPAAPAGTQLSIFEVDPGSIETEAPAADTFVEVPRAAESSWTEAAEPAARSDWSTPEWSGMKLGAHTLPEPTPVLVNKLALAPLTTRLMAGLVDGSIAVAIATFLWLTLALGMSHTLAPRMAEMLGAGVLAFATLAYHAFFCLIAMPTPGMRYARLSLCTFDEMIPTPQQLRRRFGAMIISALPLGLGMAWSLFDEDRLAWHDRHSQTYLRHN